MKEKIIKEAKKQEITTGTHINAYLETKVIKLDKEIKNLIETRKIFKRNKLDYQLIQALIDIRESDKKECIDIITENDILLDEIFVENILTNYMNRKIDKNEQAELLDMARKTYERKSPNLNFYNRRGLSEWLRKVDVDNYIDDLDFELTYCKNIESDWADLYITLVDINTGEEVDIEFINGMLIKSDKVS